MRMREGDTIRADAGGGQYWNGTIHSITATKVRVQTAAGHLVEVDRHRGHTVNGIKPGAPDGPVAMLRVLDGCKNLSEWESEFVGDLVHAGKRAFSPKQEDMIERIYKRRVQDCD